MSKNNYVTKFDSSSVETLFTLGGDGAPKSVEGYFLGSKVIPSKTNYPDSKLHFFETEDGYVGVWGKTRLDSLLTNDHIGQMCLVTFTGMIPAKQKGRNPSYGFKLQYDPTNTKDMSGVTLEAAEPTTQYDDEDDVPAFDNAPEVAPPVRATAPIRPTSTPTAATRASVEQILKRPRQ